MRKRPSNGYFAHRRGEAARREPSLHRPCHFKIFATQLPGIFRTALHLECGTLLIKSLDTCFGEPNSALSCCLKRGVESVRVTPESIHRNCSFRIHLASLS